MKQKKNKTKGDWIELVGKDFEYIDEVVDEEHITSMSKDIYSKYIKQKVENAAIRDYNELKDMSKKMKGLKYDKLNMQMYLKSNEFSLEENKLMFSLRSNCYPARMNFKLMNEGDLKCIFKCDEYETQEHIFEHCEPLKMHIKKKYYFKISSIYGSFTEQKNAIQICTEIDKIRKIMKYNILPGGSDARTHANI